MKRIIGATGAFQQGKQEVGKVWKDLGWEFVDVNKYVNEVHIRDRNGLYTDLGLAELGLREDGGEHLFYFQRLMRNPDIHRVVQDHEVAYVTNRLREDLPLIKNTRIVISWGYVFQLLDSFQFDHVVLFEARQDIWFRRVRRVFERFGHSGESITEAEIIELATAIEMNPDVIRSVVQSKCQGKWSRLDTSADDWGEQELRKLITTNGW